VLAAISARVQRADDGRRYSERLRPAI